jgi:hypothetical protein
MLNSPAARRVVDILSALVNVTDCVLVGMKLSSAIVYLLRGVCAQFGRFELLAIASAI